MEDGGPTAAPDPVAELSGEVSCPVCSERFRDPVSIHCGHNFCRVCITRCWEWATSTFSCPRCRAAAPRKDLRPNRELARVLEEAKRLSSPSVKGEAMAEEEEGCEKHREPLKVFREDDRAFVCAVCRESRAHRAHTGLPVPEAVREYKGQFQTLLEGLREARDELVGVREAEMRRNWEYLEKTGAERQRVFSKLEGLRLFLEDHSHHLLSQLGHLEKEVEEAQEENVTNLTKEISRLDTLIQEVEEKSREPAGEFLQDISGTLSRLEKETFQQPPLLLPELEKKINVFREKNLTLEEALRSFQDLLMFELPEQMEVTLDPATAHPQLIVSGDGRSVRWEEAQRDPSEGSGAAPCVLGRPGVTSGRCCWDVEVTPRGSWAVGVAREPLKRREEAAGSVEMELWSMGLCEGQFWAVTSLERVPLDRLRVPRRVRVSLDCDKGQVTFFDADRRALIFAFPAASFQGERIHPWFLVWGEGARITLHP